MEKSIQEKYEEGLIVLKQFFALSDKEIKEKLLSIVGDDDKYSHILGNDSQVKRIIMNETPSEIIISFYDEITIGSYGITYKHEYGNETTIVKFNKHFKL